MKSKNCSFAIPLFCLMILMHCGASLAASKPQVTAREVMERVKARDRGDDMTADIKVILTNRHGEKRSREMKTWRKDMEWGTKTRLLITAPPEIAGVGLLSWTYDDEDRDDLQWLYIPALKKVRMITSSEKGDYFMGTDFTYDDMDEDLSINDYDYKILEVYEQDGKTMYRVESIPKTEQTARKLGYGRIIHEIRGDIWMIVHSRMFDRKDRPLKHLDIPHINKINDIWTPNMLIMVNEQTSHSTVFEFSNLQYNSRLKDELFDRNYLDRE
ncbi:MAG: outer membrane lipoprotein-sorting protein [bacterium]